MYCPLAYPFFFLSVYQFTVQPCVTCGLGLITSTNQPHTYRDHLSGKIKNSVHGKQIHVAMVCRKKPKGIIISSGYNYVWTIKNVILIVFLFAGRNSYQPGEIFIGCTKFLLSGRNSYFSGAIFLPSRDFLSSACDFYFLHGIFISCTGFLFPACSFYFLGTIFISHAQFLFFGHIFERGSPAAIEQILIAPIADNR